MAAKGVILRDLASLNAYLASLTNSLAAAAQQ